MFQFASLPLSRIPSRYAGSPIRISRYHRSCAPPPGFSQLSTSFFGFYYLGILRVPLIRFSSPTYISFSCNSFTYYSFPIVLFLKSLYGGDKRVRTADLCLARAALSQLSYIPIHSSSLNCYSIHGGHDWTRTSDPCVISTVL